MKAEIDFIKEFEDEMKELTEMSKNPEPPSQKELDQMHLIMNMVDTKHAQYQRVKDAELWDIWTKEFYPLFCEFAKIQGGKATIEINEETLVGTLIYYGHDLIINDVCCTNRTDFTLMTLFADDVNLSVKDGLLEIKIIFNVYEQVKIADNTDALEAIIEKAKALGHEERFLNLLRRSLK